ncbi:YkvA family protein [Hymenobacter sp. H14-R3]|uniref:YkvA family protein n=1 Tax=Hymenobacter sp. H14-R3 TaxID=3046308 RepID=UPI0024B9CAEC|nr:YkvA family protein [Hymenobacter sp. H14-R3]MDJ0364297.1 YkvA family protein [Hymenobacter sp. H14-R3]
MATTGSTPPNGKDIAASAIFKKFLAAAEGYITQPTRLKKLLMDAFNKAREKKEIGTIAHEVWDTLQSLFRLIKLSVSGEYTGVPRTTVIAAVAVLVYFISPIDLIPDFIPVVGLLDDMALIAWFSTSIKHELDRFHEWENTKGSAVVMENEPWEIRTAGTTNQSAKSTGTIDLPLAPSGTGQSATDAGLGSPSSTTTRPVHEAGPDAGHDTAYRGDAPGNTTEGSRADNDGRTATGGNVR